MENKKDSLNSDTLQRSEFTTSDKKLVNTHQSIESDSDIIMPFDDPNELRKINADEPKDLVFWAEQFQISVEELQTAITINGNSVREIIKYLSI